MPLSLCQTLNCVQLLIGSIGKIEKGRQAEGWGVRREGGEVEQGGGHQCGKMSGREGVAMPQKSVRGSVVATRKARSGRAESQRGRKERRMEA